MDIRERIRKMANGEINAEEELRKYEVQLKQQQEEFLRKQQEEQEREKKQEAKAAQKRAYEKISNRNKEVSARESFQTENVKELETAKKTDAGENTFNKFINNKRENPQRIRKPITDVAAT